MNKAAQILEQYIQSMRDPEQALDYVHEDAKFIVLREQASDKHHFYGTYRGVKGVRELLSKLRKDLDTQEFAVHRILGDESTAFAWGSFVHRIRPTNRLFQSNWAVVVEVEEGKIKFFHVFEDTAGLEESFAR